jgi:hypothetical protein
MYTTTEAPASRSRALRSIEGGFFANYNHKYNPIDIIEFVIEMSKGM